MVDNHFTLYVDSRFTSPFALSVYVALQEKGLAFDTVTVDLAAAENVTGALAERLPTRRVPTLVHDGFALAESTAITEYLDELFPQVPLYPADPQSRARARQVQAWLRSDLAALRQARPTEVIFRGERRGPLSADAQTAATKLIAAAEALLPLGASHLFGQWSLADVDLALMLNRLVSHGDPVPERLRAYVLEQWQRPSVQAWCALGA
ncbi:glutathione transferase [Pseudomonas japonica]|uniref:glutathione transferase n=1 Tax=Pseudomonas japonica TaxID=256466 RepID=UPI0015E3ED74|nr:glutathione transferase [Pseudomonas japonica]MBA1243554.1 glutathione transferase [Pseudomonas japonica]